ncbi:MAG: nitroreductase family protein [Planctomycetota bacterium]
MKRKLYRLLCRVLSPQTVRALRRPCLVPGDYRGVVERLEALIAARAQAAEWDGEYWAQMLRMYAHILDKGLQHDDWQSGRSLPYYRMALECARHLGRETGAEDSSVRWALEKIGEYERRQSDGIARRPEGRLEPVRCSYPDLMANLKSRRSQRNFSTRVVDAGTIGRIVESINWAPSSCNRQTARVYATNSPELVKTCMATCEGATCFSESVPAFLTFCADMRAYFLPEEVYTPYIDVALGVENCCLAAHSLGLSITLLSWARRTRDEEARLRGLLGIPQHFEIVVNGVAGYPQAAAPCPGRKPLAATLVLVGADATGELEAKDERACAESLCAQ